MPRIMLPNSVLLVLSTAANGMLHFATGIDGTFTLTNNFRHHSILAHCLLELARVGVCPAV